MNIFFSLLTYYKYDDCKKRTALNIQEWNKFSKALEICNKIDRICVLTDANINIFEDRNMNMLADVLTEDEKSDLRDLIGYVRKKIKLENVRVVKNVNLLDYDAVDLEIRKNLTDYLSKVNDVTIHLNLGCGRKIGVLAMYFAAMDIVHSSDFYSKMTDCKIKVRPFQMEDDVISEVPVLPVEKIERRKKALSLLLTLEDRKKYDEYYSEIRYLQNMRYIILKNGKPRLTKRGKTVKYFYHKIGGIR